ncbi:VanZ family protein [Patescibacteria group bacterium]|nr:VanZ family protein [Patescibacteria group bacterium]MBU1931460.1 VanZ family protein [Patescibacteria group bacterium]
MKKLIQFILLWGPVIFWCGLIFQLSSAPIPSIGQTYWQDWWIKNLAHIVEYAVLCWLIFRAINSAREKKNWFMPLLFSVIYAISDEFHQSFVFGREAWWGDVAFDTLGALLALFISSSIFNKKIRN